MQTWHTSLIHPKKGLVIIHAKFTVRSLDTRPPHGNTRCESGDSNSVVITPDSNSSITEAQTGQCRVDRRSRFFGLGTAAVTWRFVPWRGAPETSLSAVLLLKELSFKLPCDLRTNNYFLITWCKEELLMRLLTYSCFSDLRMLRSESAITSFSTSRMSLKYFVNCVIPGLVALRLHAYPHEEVVLCVFLSSNTGIH